MKRKFGTVLILLGLCCVLVAAGFFAYNQYEEHRAARGAASVMPQMVDAILSQETQPVPQETRDPELPEEETEPPGPMKTVEIDGHEYIGFLTITALKLELPVMADWSYPKLQINPCRFYGSIYTDNLVLMAHNYAKHFGGISGLSQGERVLFTDVDGHIWKFEVVDIQTTAANDAETLTCGEYDLVLFTCTYGGKSRVMVGCDAV